MSIETKYSMNINSSYVYPDVYYRYTPATKLGGYTGITMSVRLSVRPSVVRIWVSGAQLLSLYTYHHETSHADAPWGKNVPYRFWDQKVKGQGHNA